MGCDWYLYRSFKVFIRTSDDEGNTITTTVDIDVQKQSMYFFPSSYNEDNDEDGELYDKLLDKEMDSVVALYHNGPIYERATVYEKKPLWNEGWLIKNKGKIEQYICLILRNERIKKILYTPKQLRQIEKGKLGFEEFHKEFEKLNIISIEEYWHGDIRY